MLSRAKLIARTKVCGAAEGAQGKRLSGILPLFGRQRGSIEAKRDGSLVFQKTQTLKGR
jgi:hypothetical protein